MQLNLDLGTDMHEACCPSPIKTEDTKKYYPSFHYSGGKPLKIPTDGEMTVRYKKVSSEHRITDDKDHYSCTVEIREIISVAHDDYEAPSSKKTSDTEAAFDEFVKSRKAKNGEEDY